MGAGAIQAGVSSCCSCLPCASTVKNTAGSLNGRCCPHWRLIPAILNLAVNIAGIVFALIWNNPYLCIPFGAGCLASIYLIYLSWDFQNLKSFAQNNEQLAHSITELQRKNDDLQGKIDILKTHNDKLEKSAGILQQSAKDLTDENINLKNANKTLSQTVRDLEAFKTEMEESTKIHFNQLDSLTESITGVQTSVKEDREVSSQHLSVLKQGVDKLEIENEKLEKSVTTAGKQQKELLDRLLSLAKMLLKAFTEVDDLKNKELIAERAAHQLAIQKEVGRNEGLIEEQSKQIVELSRIRKGLSTSIKNLEVQVNKLQPDAVVTAIRNELKSMHTTLSPYGTV